MKRPTRNDVAKYAGVSVATISYVLNNGPRPVAEETRKRVLSAVEELGYRPHAIARSLRKGSTQTIGLLVPSLIPAFIAYLVNAVEENLAKRGYGLILASSHEDLQRESDMLNTLASRPIDGLLYIPTSYSNGVLVNNLIKNEMPLVFIDRLIPGIPADAVCTDNVNAARVATNYLIRQGCKKMVCISFSEEASSARDRVQGFQEELKDHHLDLASNQVIVARYASGESLEDYLVPYIEQHGMPDGILCTTDHFVVEAMKFFKKEGIKIPEQVKVTGSFFFSPWNFLLEPPLPIVSQNFNVIAKRAVDFLIERIEGSVVPPRLELVPAEFLERVM